MLALPIAAKSQSGSVLMGQALADGGFYEFTEPKVAGMISSRTPGARWPPPGDGRGIRPVRLASDGETAVRVNGSFRIGDRDAFVAAASGALGLRATPEADGAVTLSTP